jgi:hypothetical protein
MKEKIKRLLLASNKDDVLIGLTLLSNLPHEEIYEFMETLGEKSNFDFEAAETLISVDIPIHKFGLTSTYVIVSDRVFFLGTNQLQYLKKTRYTWPIINLDE